MADKVRFFNTMARKVQDFESLNAAQAATIVLFEHVRRLTSRKK